MKVYIVRIVLCCFIIALWYGASSYAHNQNLFPNPTNIIVKSIPEIANFDEQQNRPNYLTAFAVIASHTFTSAKRISLGLLIGLLAGFLFGLAIHFFTAYSSGNLLILKLFRGIPLLTLIPLFFCWMGGSDFGIILYIAFATFTIFATGTYEAALNIPTAFLEQSQILGATKWTTYRYIISNAILPELLGFIGNIFDIASYVDEYLFNLSAIVRTIGISMIPILGAIVVRSYDNSNMGQLIVLMIVYCILGLISCFAVRKAGEIFIH
jgi:ABC-type nitrate/sulfonate/bicarbonate transport system permease component